MIRHLLLLFLISPILISALYIIYREESQVKALWRIGRKSETRYLSERHFRPKRNKQFMIGVLATIVCTLFLVTVTSKKYILLPPLLVAIYLIYEQRDGEKRKLKRERESTDAEFPALVEVISVLIAAGESPVSALKRVSDKSHGVLSDEFKLVIKEIERGKSLTNVLSDLSLKTNSNFLRRFCDTIILAIERGAPLSEALALQVQEVRSEQHSALLAAAGKAEINLMIPVIFLILPVSILFALWPSYLALGQSIFG
mgnify:CR=1 FL=1